MRGEIGEAMGRLQMGERLGNEIGVREREGGGGLGSERVDELPNAKRNRCLIVER